jgi:hypothetical protein
MSFHGTRIAKALAIATLAAAAAAAKADSTWTVLDRWTVGGGGGWDYLTFDSPGHRLFMSRATHVDVLDTRTGKIIGTIPDTEGVHGIALAGNLHRGFTSNGKSDSVTAFDLDSLKTIKRAAVSGHNPDAILFTSRRASMCSRSMGAARMSRYWMPIRWPSSARSRCRTSLSSRWTAGMARST